MGVGSQDINIIIGYSVVNVNNAKMPFWLCNRWLVVVVVASISCVSAFNERATVDRDGDGVELELDDDADVVRRRDWGYLYTNDESEGTVRVFHHGFFCVRVRVIGGARFSTEIYNRGCKLVPTLLA